MSGRDNYVATVRYLDVKPGDKVLYVDKFGPPSIRRIVPHADLQGAFWGSDH
ncbi:hypothetical protein GE21DRAFT_1103256 [Neurospora crassa]|nr:hypothetical protein GE21DRAFT_1103256 [Neurospora crassa]